jgi:psiF repeat
MKHWIVPLIVAMIAVGTVQVAAAQGQSQGKGQGKGQGQGQAQDYSQYDDKGKGKDKDKDAYNGDANHGQVVSECNHRANERNLKGQDRKDFTEWCESRGARYKYDNKRYDGEKTCYQKANNKGLSGDKRANFLDKCFAERGDDYYGGQAPAKKKD